MYICISYMIFFIRKYWESKLNRIESTVKSNFLCSASTPDYHFHTNYLHFLYRKQKHTQQKLINQCEICNLNYLKHVYRKKKRKETELKRTASSCEEHRWNKTNKYNMYTRRQPFVFAFNKRTSDYITI